LNIYDVIDIDAYGSPTKQIDILLKKKYKGLVIATFISTANFNPDSILAASQGFTKEQIKTRPGLFAKQPYQMFCNWLCKNGVDNIVDYNFPYKNYLYFYLDK
jgi:hypothetical protein